jgi:3-mercaptopyruvate sulfurtransferase SseA
MKAHGITNAAALLGGWNEWKAANLPTEMTAATRPEKK